MEAPSYSVLHFSLLFNAVHLTQSICSCPGYIFGSSGQIVKCIGQFRDPYFLAFRGPEKMQYLYSVSIPMKNIWSPFSSAESSDDSVTLDVYEDWLETDDSPVKNVLISDSILEATAGSKRSISEADLDHQHDHDHHNDDHNHNHEHQEHNHSHEHSHDHHSHSSRIETEATACSKEAEPSDGQTLAEALLRLLIKKEIITSTALQSTIDKLESSGQQLLGATLVAKAWSDSSFKTRLIQDGKLSINAPYSKTLAQ